MRILTLMCILFFLPVLVSADDIKSSFKKEIANDNIIYFENKEQNKKADEYVSFVENMINEVLKMTDNVYKLDYVDIYVKFRSKDPLLIEHLGVGGEWINKDTIQILINIDFLVSDEDLSNNLERLLVHEIGHLIHHRNRERTYTLFETIISEGIADHLVNIISGYESEIWSTNLNDEELVHYMDLAKKEIWSTDYDFDYWLYSGGPGWIGYSLGYKIIGDYIDQNPDKSILDIIKLPDEEFFKYM